MPESSIELGGQRLPISQELGAGFAFALEGKGKADESQRELVETVRKYLSENPGAQIIGTKLDEKTTLSSIEASLSRQLGLPPGSRLKHIKSRLVGREKHFLLVFPGVDNLVDRQKNKLQKKLGKLGVKTIFG